ncbi:OLC1v1035725C1 [Oldenlandia corymbosa var. corymbosa]|uniref:OLC1v1035725C1 n=1 Tax=Oldenlandia corymbosa var. corymbosa TaxID=529605 RepID=A0AAV1CX17_OLDCO|nr:OLC1v1035725C1 [Oldenlandia corymbosa var. corymbosa]
MGDSSIVYTLDEALSTLGFGNFQALILLYGALGWVAEAMELMILSFIGPGLQSEWDLSSSEESLISTVVFAGMLIGAYLWGHVSDNCGRKKGFLGAAMFNAAAGFFSAFSPNYACLVTLRFIAGIGLGGGYLFTTWFLEFVPTSNRGSWMIIFSSFWTIGSISEALLAWIVMPRWGWRWLLVLSAVPYFIVLLFYKLAPESPRYLSLKGRLKEAQNVLEQAAELNQIKLPRGSLVSDQMLNTEEDLPPAEETHLLSSTKKETYECKRISTSPSLLSLFSRKFFRTTLLLWFLFFGTTFSYYGVILLTSELSSRKKTCGRVSFYLETSQASNLYVDVFVTSLAELPGLVLSAFIVDRVGRKVSMVIMFMLGFLLLFPLVGELERMLTTILLFGARMFVSAAFTVATIYAPEVYPTDIRTSAVGLTTSIGRIGGMICPLVAVGLVSECHQTAAVILFLGMIALSGLSVAFLPFETKGKDLSDSVNEPETK